MKGFFETAGEYADEKFSQLHAFMGQIKHAVWPIVESSNGEEQTIHPHCMINQYGRSHA